MVTVGAEPSDPDRPLPPVTGSIGRSYNEIYYDRGDRVAVVNGESRSSLITFLFSTDRAPPASWDLR